MIEQRASSSVLRTLHVMASGARGGGANHLEGLLPELLRLGIACQAAVGTDGPLLGELRAGGVPAQPLDLMRSRLDPAAPLRLARCVRCSGATLVHYHGTRAAFFGATARALAPWWPTAIYSVHGLSYRKEMPPGGVPLFAMVERIACRGAEHVISVSKTDLADLVRRGYVRPDRVSHVPNALRIESLCAAQGSAAGAHAGAGRRAEARQRLGLPADAFVVGTVARLVAQKCVGDLVAALAHCDGDDVLLVIVGDGPQRQQIEVGAQRWAGRVLLVGSRDDVPALLPAFDVFALSSRWEGEPISLLEAMAAGLPCVATATEGARELLADSGAGRLVEVGSPPAIGKALAELRADPGLRRAMGEAGRLCVSTRSYAAQAARVAVLYERVMRESQGPREATNR